MPKVKEAKEPPVDEMEKMKILMVTPEVAPYVKVGGLADIVGSLPKALKESGHDVRVVCPLYGFLDPSRWKTHDRPLIVPMGAQVLYGGVVETVLPGSEVPVYFIDHRRFFDRHEVYAGPWGDHADNGERFSFFSRASLELCRFLNWIPDVFHCHDWTAGLLPVYLNTTQRSTELGACATVMTIHNLKFQGIFQSDLLEFAGLPREVFRTDGLECMGSLNMMKGGLYHSTKVSTVSPTYAEEIQGPERGEGLNHVLKFRGGDLVGILNGIDTALWDPGIDAALPANYGLKDLTGKTQCKLALQETLNLEVDGGIPVFGLVSRLYDQKGVDLVADIADRALSAMQIQLVILGSGDPGIEGRLAAAAARHPGRMAVRIGFDDGLARRIYAGSDFFLMPSRFEPCGLGQMYAMRYGSPPIVRSTGGLVDTVDPYVEGLMLGSGFRFELPTADALYYAVGWACSTFYDRPDELHALRQNGMAKDFSWGQSARRYGDLYAWAVDARKGPPKASSLRRA